MTTVGEENVTDYIAHHDFISSNVVLLEIRKAEGYEYEKSRLLSKL